MFFDEKIAKFHVDVTKSDDAIKLASNELLQRGIVKKDFLKKILERERVYPTGLAIGKFGVAIPHTDSVYVNRSQIAFMSLKNPVKFKNMGNVSEDVDVNYLFMIAMSQPHEQSEILVKLMEMFADADFMEKLERCDNIVEYVKILKEKNLI